MQQALSSQPHQQTSLACLVALCKASTALLKQALERLVPALLQQLAGQPSPEQLSAACQLSDAVTQELLPASSAAESSVQLWVAQAVLQAAEEAESADSGMAAALARLVAAATAACSVEDQHQLAAQAGRLLQALPEHREQDTLVRMAWVAAHHV